MADVNIRLGLTWRTVEIIFGNDLTEEQREEVKQKYGTRRHAYDLLNDSELVMLKFLGSNAIDNEDEFWDNVYARINRTK